MSSGIEHPDDITSKESRRYSSTSLGMTSWLKEDFDKLNAFPFSGNVRIERGALDPRAVFRRCLRVEHLAWITAASGARDDSLDTLPLDRRRRRWFSCGPRAHRRGKGLRCGSGGNCGRNQ